MAGEDPGRYLELLGNRLRATGTAFCLGIDPAPPALPAGYPADVAGVEAFGRLLLEHAAPHASAVKFNLAFFEAFGGRGIAALERLRALVPDGVPVIVDAKRADVPSTSSRHAVALLDVLAADAVTLNPYLGRDALEPFLSRPRGFVYLLCRTSNPGAEAIQSIVTAASAAEGHPAEPLFLRVARVAQGWADAETLGFVVGATAPAELRAIRKVARDRPFLVPGIGAQGGDIEGVLEGGPARAGRAAELPGGGLLVNVSRGVAEAAVGAPDPGEAVAAAAGRWATQLGVVAAAGARGR